MSDAKAIVIDYMHHVWNDGEVDACDRYLTTTYTIHHDPGDPWHGQTLDLAGYKARLSQSRAPFPDQHFAVQAMYADGDAVVMTWLWSATHRGDIPGYAATGQPITMSGATAYFFDAGDRLTGHWQITDRLGVFQQLERNKAG